MQNLNVEETNQKNKKFKHEIKNGERNKNVVMQGTVDNIITSEDATKVVQEFEQIVKNKKVTLYGWPSIKDKYFKNLKKKNDLLA